MERAGEHAVGDIAPIQWQAGMRAGVGKGGHFVTNLAEHDGLALYGHSLGVLIGELFFIEGGVPVGHDDSVPYDIGAMTENDFNQYRRIVMELVSQAPLSTQQTPDLDNLMAVAKLMIDDDPSSHQTLIDGITQLANGKVIAGLDKRPVYPLLALHIHLAAFGKHYLVLPDNVWETAATDFDKLANPLRITLSAYLDTPPAFLDTAITLWQAYCLLEIGMLRHAEGDVEIARGAIEQIVSRVVKDDSLTEQHIDQTLDDWTYRELTGMHALAGAALLDRNETWANRVEQVGLHHLYNTQPDHCTSEPWGLFGFLWSEQTRMFGMQQIHDVKAYGLVGVGRVLLADAVRCLDEFEE